MGASRSAKDWILTEMTSKRLRCNRITVHSARQPWRVWLIAALILGLAFLLRGVLQPFVIAALLAYVLLPLHHKLSRRTNANLSATLTLTVAMAGVAVIALVVLPLLISQLALLIERLPQLLNSVNLASIPWLNSVLGDRVSFDSAAVQQWVSGHAREIGQMAGKVLPTLSAGGMAVLGWLVNLALIPLVMFYAIRDGADFTRRLQTWVPPRWVRRLQPVLRDIDTVMGEFLRGQLVVMLLMSAYYSIFLAVVGLDYALPVGLVAGLLVFIPYVGMLTALTLATLSGWLQFGTSVEMLWLWGVFSIGQMLEGFVVTPLLVGDRIGLHPVVVVFALMAFGQLFGFMGILLALPASAALLVGLRHLQPLYFNSRFYRA